MPDDNRHGLRRTGVVTLVCAAVVALAVLLLHFLHLSSARDTLDKETSRGPAVQVATAGSSPAARSVTVLASVRPFQEATLYAKVSGYLEKVLVDKGDVVKAGQLLATVKSDETDAIYNSARADFLNKQQVSRRYDQLLKESAIAALTADQADADARIAKSTVDQDATLKAYERLLAPFDGKVTARFADPGALVQNAQTSQTSAQPVVTISDTHILRVQAYVSQDVALFVHDGDTVQIVDSANSGRSVQAKISHVAGELDPRTRTMLVEVDLPNTDNLLLGGSLAYMTLHIPVSEATTVPVDALVTKGTDQFVAVLGSDSRLHYIKVAIANTDGEMVTLVDGVKPGTKVGINLPTEATDGTLVHAIQSPTK